MVITEQYGGTEHWKLLNVQICMSDIDPVYAFERNVFIEFGATTIKNVSIFLYEDHII